VGYRRRALGSAPKLVPGLTAPSSLPPGRTAPYDYGALQRHGLPLAPVVQYGSWRTGQPHLYQYGRDPYRGLGSVSRWLCEGDPVMSEATEAFKQELRQISRGAMFTTVATGLAAGALGGLLGSTLWGAVAGGALGYFAYATQVAIAEG